MNLQDSISTIREFNRLYTKYLGVFDRKIFSTELTWSEARILLEIYLNSLETLTDVAEFLGVDKAYISRIIKKFKDKGLIESTQDSKDKRKYLIEITPKGLELVETINLESNKQIFDLFEDMSEHDISLILNAMDVISKKLK